MSDEALDDHDDDEDDDSLPPEIPEDLLKAKIEQLVDGARQMGLYLMGCGVRVDDEPEEGEPPHHQLMAQFSIGKLAFANRVQDPEAEKVDDAFREIASGTVDDDVAAIKARYTKRTGAE